MINTAAYTAVDAAESDRETAHLVNAAAPGAMAEAAARRGIPFLHVSTDYVFDGTGTRSWREDDPTAPLGAYGASKLDGEGLIAAAAGPHVILRTSWVFSAHGRNFVKTMLRLGAELDSLSVVADQRGGPTAAADIAGALLDHRSRLHRWRGKIRRLPLCRCAGPDLGRFRRGDLRCLIAAHEADGQAHRHRRLSDTGAAARQLHARLRAHPRGLWHRAARLAGKPSRVIRELETT